MTGKQQYLPIGIVEKSHGIRGEILILLTYQNTKFASDFKEVWLGESLNHISSWKIESVNQSETKVFLKLREVNSIEEAKFLKGLQVFLPYDFIPDRHVGYTNGFIVKDNHTNMKIGTVIEFIENSTQDQLLINTKNGERVIPAVPEFIEKINWENQTIFLNIIEGIL